MQTDRQTDEAYCHTVASLCRHSSTGARTSEIDKFETGEYARGHGALPPNGCNDNVIVSGEALLSAENSERKKPLGGRGSTPNLTGGAHNAPQTP